jgi:RimJ/RimL family protein N-acetyltransferase
MAVKGSRSYSLTTKPLNCSAIGIQPLEGNQLQLVRASPQYTDFIYDCYKNDAFMDLYRLAQSRNLSKQQIHDRLTLEQKKLPQELNRIEWVVLKKQEDTSTLPIGLAALADYQPHHQRGELLVGILEKEHRSKGAGIEASLLIFDFAFNQVKVHKLITLVYGYNAFAQKNVLNIGFKQEGHLKDHLHTRSGFIDLYQNALLKEDFFNNDKLRRLSLKMLKKDITLPHKVVANKVSEELLAQLKQTIKLGS